MIEFLGSLGALCLMIAVLPLVFKVVKQGHADGISATFLIFLMIGFISMISYVVLKHAGYPLLVSYSVNLTSYIVIIYYKFSPRK